MKMNWRLPFYSLVPSWVALETLGGSIRCCRCLLWRQKTDQSWNYFTPFFLAQKFWGSLAILFIGPWLSNSWICTHTKDNESTILTAGINFTLGWEYYVMLKFYISYDMLHEHKLCRIHVILCELQFLKQWSVLELRCRHIKRAVWY